MLSRPGAVSVHSWTSILSSTHSSQLLTLRCKIAVRIYPSAIHCSRVGAPEYVVCREDNPYKVARTRQTIVCSLVQIGLVFKTVCTSKEDMKRSRARVTLGGQYLLLQIRNKVPRILRKITKYPCESHLARCIAEPLKFF